MEKTLKCANAGRKISSSMKSALRNKHLLIETKMAVYKRMLFPFCYIELRVECVGKNKNESSYWYIG